jgi:hypothetical protein
MWSPAEEDSDEVSPGGSLWSGAVAVHTSSTAAAPRLLSQLCQTSGQLLSSLITVITPQVDRALPRDGNFFVATEVGVDAPLRHAGHGQFRRCVIGV